MHRALLSLAFLGVLSCSSKQGVDRPQTVTGGEPSVATSDASVAAPAPPSAPPAQTVPADAVACPNDRVQCSMCDADGREILTITRNVLAIDASLKVISRSPPSGIGGPRRFRYRIGVNEQELVARIETCPGCARIIGWSVRVQFDDLARLPAEDRSKLQEALGFLSMPLLGSAAEFRKATASAPDRNAVELPSCARARSGSAVK